MVFLTGLEENVFPHERSSGDERELAESPGHPFTLFNLGMTFADVGRFGEAVGHLEGSLRNSASRMRCAGCERQKGPAAAISATDPL